MLLFILICSEQLQVLDQFVQFFGKIINTKIKYKVLPDTEQNIHSYMVINEFTLILMIYFIYHLSVFTLVTSS